jgi:hypothetical protein
MNGTQKDFDRQIEKQEAEEYLTKSEREAEIVTGLRKHLRRYVVTKAKGGWSPEQCEMLSLEGLLDAAKHFAAHERKLP